MPTSVLLTPTRTTGSSLQGFHFTRNFKYRFYARSYDGYGYPEQVEVLYSTTTVDPSAFTRIDSVSVSSYYSWVYKEYDIPANAKYVALRAVTKAGKSRCLLIDDVAFGYADALPATPGYMPASHVSTSRMPALDGAYEIYLDGNKVAQQDETEYEFTNLSAGTHTAGVRSAYTSGFQRNEHNRLHGECYRRHTEPID